VFKFEGQQHYETFSKFVALSVAELVQKEFDLEQVMLPLEEDRGDCPVTFPILHSKDIATNPRLIVIVLGAGHVELGQWARSLCINQSLAMGSLLPFVREAIKKRGCSVLLTNPNINTWANPVTRKLAYIPGNRDPEAHLYYLYKNFIADSEAKEISIIAHSFGGTSTMSLLSREDAVEDLLGDAKVEGGRLKSVTFTDSVHSAFMGSFGLSKSTRKWLTENAINFIRSKDKLGTEYTPQSATQRQSAGTNDHASTSYYSRDLLWQWIDARMPTTDHEASDTSASPDWAAIGPAPAANEDAGESDSQEDDAPRRKKTTKRKDDSASNTTPRTPKADREDTKEPSTPDKEEADLEKEVDEADVDREVKKKKKRSKKMEEPEETQPAIAPSREEKKKKDSSSTDDQEDANDHDESS
jgi:hypothetical protein